MTASSKTKWRSTGRLRKDGRRLKSGELAKAPRAERRDDAQATALSARCAAMGWPDTPENRKRASAPHLESILGQFYERGKITEAMLLAGDALRMQSAAYLKTIGAPSLHARAASLPMSSEGAQEPRGEASVPIPVDDEAERHAAIRARYDAACEAMGDHGGIVQQVAVLQMQCRSGDLETLRAGLGLLAVHYSI